MVLWPFLSCGFSIKYIHSFIHARMCLLGSRCCLFQFRGCNPSQKTHFRDVNWALSSLTCKILKPAYYENKHIDFNQFCITMQTTKYSSSMIQIHAQLIQDGGWPQSPYLHSPSINLNEILHGQAYWPL